MSKTNDGGSAFPAGLMSGMSLRDWFAGQAPPMPRVVFDAFVESLAVNEPDDMAIPWNDYVLSRLATQEARWRRHFADAMLAERNRT